MALILVDLPVPLSPKSSTLFAFLPSTKARVLIHQFFLLDLIANHDLRLGPDLQAALDSLPPEFRAAVVLCDIEGLSYEEIGATLDVKLAPCAAASTVAGRPCASTSPAIRVTTPRRPRHSPSPPERCDVSVPGCRATFSSNGNTDEGVGAGGAFGDGRPGTVFGIHKE